MAYDAKAVANYFLVLAEQGNSSLTPMKLQKLIFFAHGWNLALYKEPLIVDPIEAWQFGPVIPSVYHEFKHARNGAISSRAVDFDLEKFELVEPTLPADDSRTKLLLKKIWEAYGKLSAMQLSNLTHLSGTPWAATRERYGATTRNAPIHEELIRDYFQKQAEKNAATA